MEFLVGHTIGRLRNRALLGWKGEKRRRVVKEALRWIFGKFYFSSAFRRLSFLYFLPTLTAVHVEICGQEPVHIFSSRGFGKVFEDQTEGAEI